MQTNTFHSEGRSAERFLVSLPVETDRGPGLTRDVSASGLYLVTEQPLAAGDRLQLVVTVPDRDHASPLLLSVKGTVVWVRSAGETAGVGIAFGEEGGCLVQGS
jgi:hypothetical protein